MITVYFRNEETAYLPNAMSVDYRAVRVRHEDGAAEATETVLSILVCKTSEGQDIGAFLLDQIVGWDADEGGEDEDEEDD